MDVIDALSGGDLRSIGRADEVVGYVLGDEARFAAVIEGTAHADPVVRMRCSDVAEKASGQRPEWLGRYKHELLDIAGQSTQQEVRWHLAQMLPRLEMSVHEHEQVNDVMFGYLEDKSRIVQTFAMVALAGFASKDVDLKQRFLPVLEGLVKTGSPAVQSRGRKLLAALKEHGAGT